jgi:cytochrome c oxidase cbb3-type subunit III
MVEPENKTPENRVSPAERQYPDPQAKMMRDGKPTTGHSWDGIEEFDNPMPRWWLWTFYLTIIWAVGYMILYPAWPLVTQATTGVLGYSSRAEVANEIATFETRNQEWFDRLVTTDLNAIAEDQDLQRFAVNAGGAVFRAQCSQCHGTGGAGVQAAGFPNLLDDDWLWGGDIEAIHTTISHGIRNGGDEARFSQMPAYGDMLSSEEIGQVVQYVRKISNQEHDAAAAEAGTVLYADNCSSCHAEDGTGDRTQGAPNLTDAIWLYGGSVEALTHTVRYARYGVMPGWTARLSEADIRAVAVYVHGLGGGE